MSGIFPFVWVLPVIGFLIGLGSARLDGKRVLSLVIVLMAACGTLLSLNSRIGRVDPLMTVLPPVLTVVGFFVGLAIRRLILRR